MPCSHFGRTVDFEKLRVKLGAMVVVCQKGNNMAYEIQEDVVSMSLTQQAELIEQLSKACDQMEPACVKSAFFKMVEEKVQEYLSTGQTENPLNRGLIHGIYEQIATMNAHAEKHGITFEHSSLGTPVVRNAGDEEIENTLSVEKLLDFLPVMVAEDAVIFPEESGLGWAFNSNIPNGFYVAEVRKAPRDADGINQINITGVRKTENLDESLFPREGTAAENIAVYRLPEHGHAVQKPIPDPTFHVEPAVRDFMSVIFEESQKKPQKVMISGPQGTGKTSAIRQLAAEQGYNYLQISCGMVEGASEWFGFRDAQDGEIVYVTSAFVEACETPNTVIMLDEFNRLHSTLQNSLYNILDDFGSAWLDYVQRYIRVASGVIFCATCNIGAAHTGTFQMDAAMADRFNFHIVMSHLSEDDEVRVLRQKTGVEEDMARRLVRVAGKVREQVRSDESTVMTHVSFRQLEAAAILIVNGMPPHQAAEFTILPMYSDEGGTESERALVMQIVQGVFPNKTGR